MIPNLLLLTTFSSYFVATKAVELTFELQDRDTQCFFEDIKKNEQSTVEYQVNHVWW